MKKEKNDGKKKEETKTKAPEPVSDDFVISDKQMEQLIYDLSKTVYWHAIVKYLSERQILAEKTIYGLDPFKQPTDIARAQGIRQGLFDLPDYVESLERIRQEKAKGDAGI